MFWAIIACTQKANKSLEPEPPSTSRFPLKISGHPEPARNYIGVTRLQGTHCAIGVFEFKPYRTFLPLVMR
jgi:hypothetical protein